MAKKPAAKKEPPKLRVVEAVDRTEVSVRDRLIEIVRSLAKLGNFDVTDAEINSIVDEQFIHPTARATARYHRRADEMFCQYIERDARFLEAVAIATGEVF